MQNSVKVIAGLLLSSCLFACNASNSGVYDPYYGAWFDAYGHVCADSVPTPGCDYYSNGMKIYISADPYYTGQSINEFWQSPDGIIYSSGGYAINQDHSSGETLDVLSQASDEEKMLVEKVGKTFSDRYALNEVKGIQIAQTLRDWAVVGHNRARTNEDTALFMKRMYGIDSDQALKEVAAHWGTTPEVSKAILKNWYKSELSQSGL